MDTKLYWAKVREVQHSLPADAVWLYPQTNDQKGTSEQSLDAKGNHTGPPQLVEADREIAAMRLVERTHRLATKAEVEAYRARQEEQSRKTIARESARAMKNISLSPEQFARILHGTVPEVADPNRVETPRKKADKVTAAAPEDRPAA